MQKSFIILLIALVLLFFIYSYARQVYFEGFIEKPAGKKMLLDETDLKTFAGPSVREELMRLDPKFLEQQLEIYGQSRKIFSAIIDVAAGVIGSTQAPTLVDKEAAIAAIAKEAGGQRPDFCTKGRVESLLDEPAGSAGLDGIFKCLPSHPSRYLLLLSYASKLLKEQLEGAGATLGGDYAGEGGEEPPSFPIDTRGASPTTEGFTGDSSTSADGAYVSAYALETPPRPTSGSSAVPLATLRSAIENQLEAWKAVFDTESIKRIQLYLRYCKGALKKIDTITEDARSGKLMKKMRYGERLNATGAAVMAQIPALASAAAQKTGSFQLPL
jgi:hypothetical protein